MKIMETLEERIEGFLTRVQNFWDPTVRKMWLRLFLALVYGPHSTGLEVCGTHNLPNHHKGTITPSNPTLKWWMKQDLWGVNMEILLTNNNASKEIIQENLERKLSTQFRLYVSLNHASVYMVQTLDYKQFFNKEQRSWFSTGTLCRCC